MPLVLLCGYPCSGKSSLVKSLIGILEQRLANYSILCITEPCLSSDQMHPDPRCEIYADSYKERELRARHKSEIEQALTGNRSKIIIMDAPNYIKGYRYELYCLAKSLGHQQLVLYCNVPKDIVIQWNNQIGRYPDPNLFTSMLLRFEEPQPTQRWDNPLILASPHEWSESGHDVDRIADELVGLIVGTKCKPVKPNKSTQLKHVSPTDYLQKLDTVTQQVIEHLLRCQHSGQSIVGLPQSILVKSESATSPQLDLTGRDLCKMADLMRLKRQYISIRRGNFDSTMADECSMAQSFLNYLKTSIDNHLDGTSGC